jgi:hypothetical protein
VLQGSASRAQNEDEGDDERRQEAQGVEGGGEVCELGIGLDADGNEPGNPGGNEGDEKEPGGTVVVMVGAGHDGSELAMTSVSR